MKIYQTFLISLLFVSGVIHSQDSFNYEAEQLNSIELRVASMTYDELLERNALLKEEKALLIMQKDETQNPSNIKEMDDKLNLINAEMSQIRQALIAILGVGAATALLDDDDSSSEPISVGDTTPPVITINGSNPVTLELGTAYEDAGATATDDVDGSVTVSVGSGGVDVNTAGSYEVVYSATDSSGNSSTATRVVNVVDTVAPVITSTAFTADENQTAIGTVTSTEASGSVSYATASTETELAITSAGVLSFVAAPDFETKSTITSYITATDPSGNSSTALITVTVNDLNDNSPVITSTAFTADENQTAIGTVTATDADADDTITFSVASTETELAITSAGVLSFVVAPDFETKSSITAYVTATDAGGNTDTELVTVTVNDLNEAPSITSTFFTAVENQTVIGTVTATDPDAGDTLTFSVASTETELAITSAGVLSFVTAADYETKSVVTAYVTVTDSAGNTDTELVTVSVTNDESDDAGTSTGTGTGTSTSTGTGTGTSTSTGTGTGTGTGTSTSTGTGTSTGTST